MAMSRPKKPREMAAAGPRSIMTAQANAKHGVPMQRADVLEGCTEGSRKPSSKRWSNAIEAYEAKRWLLDKEPGGKG
jgi:hypothetical protein